MVILDQSVARALPVFLIDSTDHVTPKTGIAEGSVTVKISKNLGTLTAFTLTGLWTEIGQGLYKIAFAATDLDTVGFFGYLVTATGCDQFSGMQYVGTLGTNVAAVKAKTDNLPANPASQTNLDVAVSTRAAPGAQMALTAAEETAIQGKIIDDAIPYHGASIAAIKAKTDVIGASVALESGGNLAAIKAQTDKFLFDVSNFVKSTAQNPELAYLDADISSRETPAHATALASALALQIDDLITRAKGLNEIYDSVALRALETTLTAIKGVGWTNETLKYIKELVDALQKATFTL